MLRVRLRHPFELAFLQNPQQGRLRAGEQLNHLIEGKMVPPCARSKNGLGENWVGAGVGRLFSHAKTVLPQQAGGRGIAAQFTAYERVAQRASLLGARCVR